jgi:hypothetical protein
MASRLQFLAELFTEDAPDYTTDARGLQARAGRVRRDLSAAEVNEVRDMTRRIAALLLLEPALDENYIAVKQNTHPFPA